MVEVICRAISPEQYHFPYCPAKAAINISEFKQKCSCIKMNKILSVHNNMVIGLHLEKNNAHTLRARALLFPSLGSITMLIWYGPFRYYCYYIEIFQKRKQKTDITNVRDKYN